MRNPAPLATPEALNQSWSIDFMHDALVCGRRFRTFNVVDDFNRESLAKENDLNIPAQRVVWVMDRIVVTRGYPLKSSGSTGHTEQNPGFLPVQKTERSTGDNRLLADGI